MKAGTWMMMKLTGTCWKNTILQPEAFYSKLQSEEYKEMAHYEFALMKQLQVNGYPTVFMQTERNKICIWWPEDIRLMKN